MAMQCSSNENKKICIKLIKICSLKVWDTFYPSIYNLNIRLVNIRTVPAEFQIEKEKFCPLKYLLKISVPSENLSASCRA